MNDELHVLEYASMNDFVDFSVAQRYVPDSFYLGMISHMFDALESVIRFKDYAQCENMPVDVIYSPMGKFFFITAPGAVDIKKFHEVMQLRIIENVVLDELSTKSHQNIGYGRQFYKYFLSDRISEIEGTKETYFVLQSKQHVIFVMTTFLYILDKFILSNKFSDRCSFGVFTQLDPINSPNKPKGEEEPYFHSNYSAYYENNDRVARMIRTAEGDFQVIFSLHAFSGMYNGYLFEETSVSGKNVFGNFEISSSRKEIGFGFFAVYIKLNGMSFKEFCALNDEFCHSKEK